MKESRSITRRRVGQCMAGQRKALSTDDNQGGFDSWTQARAGPNDLLPMT